MGRRKKIDVVAENPTPMENDALNLPVEEKTEEAVEESKQEVIEPVKEDEIKSPVAKRVNSPSSLVNVRESPNGEILFRLNNGQKIMVEDEKDGWSKITAYIMTELVGEL